MLEISTDNGNSWQKLHSVPLSAFNAATLARFEENRAILKQYKLITDAVDKMQTNLLVTPVKLTHDGRYAELLVYLLRRSGLHVTYRGHYIDYCLINIYKK